MLGSLNIICGKGTDFACERCKHFFFVTESFIELLMLRLPVSS